MSKDEFTKLFVYMERRFDAVEKKLEEKADKTDLDRIIQTLDGIVAQHDTLLQEFAMAKYQTDRHDRWIHQLADHTKFNLKHGS